MTSRTVLALVVLGLLVVSQLDVAGTDNSIKPPKGRAAMIYKPNIQYPAEAKYAGITGSGVVVVKINPKGEVTDVTMAKSTGSKILDDATVTAFRSARFRPGTVPVVKIPIRFTLGGGAQFYEYVDVKKKKMDDVLTAFLGKGTVLKGPIPSYPRRPAWTHKSGKGVYELHADSTGSVDRVKILKSSGDAAFDREAVKTLGKWRLRRGPLFIELPLRFTLTPDTYSVDVGP